MLDEHKDCKETEDELWSRIEKLEDKITWISVDESQPERGDMCLFCIPTTALNFIVAGYVEDSEYRFMDASLLDQYGDSIGYSADTISHWTPLPEPPKESK